METLKKNQASISKINAKKRIVYGIVYEPMKADSYKDFMTADSIETMAHRFMLESRMQDENHDWIKGAGHPVESFIVREGDPDFVDKDGKAIVGAWVLGSKVTDDNLWKRIAKGDIKAFSWAGVAEYGKEQQVESDWFDDEGNRIDPYGDDK